MEQRIEFSGIAEGLSGGLSGGLSLVEGMVDGRVACLVGSSMGYALGDGESLLYVHEYGNKRCAVVCWEEGAKRVYGWVGLLEGVGGGVRQRFDYLAGRLVSDVKALGAALVFATDVGVVVYSLDKGSYVLKYGGALAMPRLEFAVVGGGVRYGVEAIDFAKAAKGDVVERGKAWGSLGVLYRAMTDKNRFVYSFVLRWAIELYDGSYINHSSPIVFDLVSGGYPAVTRVHRSFTHDGHDVGDTQVGVEGLQFRLAVRLAEGFDVNRFFADGLVRSVSVFVSAPILPYDAANEGLAVALRAGRADTPFKAWTGGYYSRDGAEVGFAGLRYAVGGVNVDYDALTRPRVDMGSGGVGDRVYRGLYRGVYLDSARVDDVDWLTPSGTYADMSERLCREGVFYLLKRYDAGAFSKEVSGAWSFVSLADGALSALTSQPTLPDAYRGGVLMGGGRLFVYNNRVHRWGMSMRLRLLERMEGVVGNVFLSEGIEEVVCRVHVSMGGVVRYVRWEGVGRLGGYVYVPIAGAYLLEVVVRVSGGGYRRGALRLSKHPSLVGSYGYWDWSVFSSIGAWGEALGSGGFDVVAVGAGEDLLPASELLHVSAYNNPLSWPALGELSFGGGVVGLGVNTRAVSEGQFGQHPLLAFTEDGIYALGVGGSGWYVSKQAISREVCSGVDSICSIDDGVVFATKSGLRVVLGGEVRALGGVADGVSDVVVSGALDFLGDLLGGGLSEVVADGVVSVPLFLQGAKVSYDGVNGRVYAVRGGVALCLSLSTQRWSVMSERGVCLVDQWPYLYGVWGGGRMLARVDCLDRAVGGVGLVGGLPERVCVLTNAIDFGSMDLKVLEELELLGYGNQGAETRVWLWGSNDGIGWSRVGFGYGWRVGRLVGRSYRYWRVGVVGAVGGVSGYRLEGARVRVGVRYGGRYRRLG